MRHSSFLSKQRSRSEALETMAVAKVTNLIQQNPLVIFSKTTCPYCKKVKELFKSLGANAKIIEINQEEDGVELQKALGEITKQRTVPSVFIGGEHVGGCDATVAANKKGTLVPMLKKAGALKDVDDQQIEGEVTKNEEGNVESAKEGLVQGVLEA